MGETDQIERPPGIDVGNEHGHGIYRIATVQQDGLCGNGATLQIDRATSGVVLEHRKRGTQLTSVEKAL